MYEAKKYKREITTYIGRRPFCWEHARAAWPQTKNSLSTVCYEYVQFFCCVNRLHYFL